MNREQVYQMVVPALLALNMYFFNDTVDSVKELSENVNRNTVNIAVLMSKDK